MMMGMFEVFDPVTFNSISLNWVAVFMPLFLIYHSYWFIPSRYSICWFMLIDFMFNEFKLLIHYKYWSNIFMFIVLMIYLMLLNLFGLIPYIFTVTSHMVFNLVYSTSLWMSFMIYMYINMPMKSLSHLVPKNTPIFLMNFMVIIEFISNIIRPITLSIRLTANLLSGHLLMTLMGLFMSKIALFTLIFMILIQNILFFLEISMAFIQSYVFSVLSVLYFSESK